ncbi:hypothetical protein, partial [Salmonella enterica]|uniref:hypothetical protein n=1 Tax=Salmonella enterica TaxID=28901 RepID=UPI003F76D12A
RHMPYSLTGCSDREIQDKIFPAPAYAFRAPVPELIIGSENQRKHKKNQEIIKQEYNQNNKNK